MRTNKIRFWTFLRSEPVQIKLRAGDTVRHHWAEQTDEGWKSETHVWSFDGRSLHVECCDDGRDCDGRLTRYHTAHCPAELAKAGFREEETGVSYPAWQCGSGSQRDEYAELSGY